MHCIVSLPASYAYMHTCQEARHIHNITSVACVPALHSQISCFHACIHAHMYVCTYMPPYVCVRRAATLRASQEFYKLWMADTEIKPTIKVLSPLYSDAAQYGQGAPPPAPPMHVCAHIPSTTRWPW